MELFSHASMLKDKIVRNLQHMTVINKVKPGIVPVCDLKSTTDCMWCSLPNLTAALFCRKTELPKRDDMLFNYAR